MGHGSWVTLVLGQFTDGSDGLQNMTDCQLSKRHTIESNNFAVLAYTDRYIARPAWRLSQHQHQYTPSHRLHWVSLWCRSCIEHKICYLRSCDDLQSCSLHSSVRNQCELIGIFMVNIDKEILKRQLSAMSNRTHNSHCPGLPLYYLIYYRNLY